MDDIELARTQMRQDGVVHPQQTRGVPIETLVGDNGSAQASATAQEETQQTHGAAEPTASLASAVPTPIWLDRARQRPVRSVDDALARLQEDYRRYRATTITPAVAIQQASSGEPPGNAPAAVPPRPAREAALAPLRAAPIRARP